MGKPKMVSVYADEHGHSAKVINEDGTVVEGIRSVTVYIEAGQFNRVEIELNGTPVQVQGTVGEVQLTCMSCGGIEDHKCETLFTP